MSNEKQETIADIVAEMRLGVKDWKGERLGVFDCFADRIEAASKREREAGAEAAQVCGEIGEMIGREATREKESRVGNSACTRRTSPKRKESDMNPINPVCRPATENEINYGEAKWCAKCTSECDSKGKDELVMCDYFKTNDNDPIVPGCPSLMPHALPGGFDSIAPAEEGTPMPEPKDFAAKAKLHLVHAMTKHPYFADKIYFSSNKFDTQEYNLSEARNRLKYEIENKMVHASTVLECEICEAMFAAESGTNGEAISECYDAIAVLMRMIMFFEGTQKLGNPPTKGFHAEMNRCEIGEAVGREATREKSSRVGNAAKMRDALEAVVKVGYPHNFQKEAYHIREYCYEITTAIKKCFASLASSPRNCDRPECATTKAAQDVWDKEDGGKTAYYEWLLQQYKEGESEVEK